MQPTMGTQPGHSSFNQARVKKEKPWEVGEDHQSCLSGHGHGENLRSFILFTETETILTQEPRKMNKCILNITYKLKYMFT